MCECVINHVKNTFYFQSIKKLLYESGQKNIKAYFENSAVHFHNYIDIIFNVRKGVDVPSLIFAVFYWLCSSVAGCSTLSIRRFSTKTRKRFHIFVEKYQIPIKNCENGYTKRPDCRSPRRSGTDRTKTEHKSHTHCEYVRIHEFQSSLTLSKIVEIRSVFGNFRLFVFGSYLQK